MAGAGEDVYCTLVMSDSYLPGAAVLAHSLRDAGTTKKLACLITLDTLAADTISKLDSLYDYLIPVERTANPTPSNLYLMGRPDLLFTFTKIALWRQTRFRKIVYIDADVVALRAPDELFDIDAPFAAAPDIGWPDAFNTGVMVISPNMGEYWALHTMASSGDSFDGADQGLLNQYYEHKKWHRLSFTYNCTPNAEYQWEPAYRHYKSHISMVHFIGKNKPWTKARNQGSGVYSELLARWWAVHDRHLKESASELVVQTQTSAAQPPIARPPTAQPHVEKEVEQKVEQEVEKGDRSTGFEHPALGYTDHIPTTVVRAAPTTTPETPATEVPMTEPGEPAENIEQGVTQPTPTVEQRRFSAPHAEWDATRNAPPPESKPEAANFPNQVYTFSDEQSLFQPPSSYPEPPKDMWYQVPESKPKTQEKPKPIFPWEMGRETPKPTRVFLDDLPTPPQPEPESDLAPSFSYEKFGREPSPTHEPTEPDEYSTQPFAPTANAWDSVAGIDRYVRAVMEAQARRGIKSPSTAPAPGAIEELLSPIAQQSDPTRRESLILTDFPSAIERPSLPVTPAPIRRPMFWGEERDAAGELPMAEGVPDQAEWNPDQQLEQLRRSSLLEFEHLRHPSESSKEIPQRAMPGDGTVEAEGRESAETGADTTTTTGTKDTGTSAVEGQASVGAEQSPAEESPAAESPAEDPPVEESPAAEAEPVCSPPGGMQFRAIDFGKGKDAASGEEDASEETLGGDVESEEHEEGVMSPSEREGGVKTSL